MMVETDTSLVAEPTEHETLPSQDAPLLPDQPDILQKPNATKTTVSDPLLTEIPTQRKKRKKLVGPAEELADYLKKMKVCIFY